MNDLLALLPSGVTKTIGDTEKVIIDGGTGAVIYIPIIMEGWGS